MTTPSGLSIGIILKTYISFSYFAMELPLHRNSISFEDIKEVAVSDECYLDKIRIYFLFSYGKANSFSFGEVISI